MPATPPSWQFVHVTDIHVGSPRSHRFKPALNDNWATAAAQIKGLRPDLLLVGGDLTRDGNLNAWEFADAAATLDATGVRWHAIPGNMDTGNNFIAGHDPLAYTQRFRKYLIHAHIKDVSPALAAALRGEETGIGSSQVPIGGGVNADNIRKILHYLADSQWSGVVSIECHGSDENMQASVDFLRGVLAEIPQAT